MDKLTPALALLLIGASCREQRPQRKVARVEQQAPPSEIPAPAPRDPPAPPPPEPPEPDDGPASRAAHAAITARQLGDDPQLPELARFVPLDHPEELAPFHAALATLAAGRAKDHVRVLVYGSSNIAGDRVPGYVRGYLQARFGDGGPGFVALAPLWRWHRHQEIELDAGKRWTAEDIRSPAPPLDGRYGLMGVRARSSSRQTITLALRGLSPQVERVAIWFDAGPGRGSFDLRASRAGAGAVVSEHVETEAEAITTGYASFEDAAGIDELALRPSGDGELVLFGAVLERAAPGVVVDELGIGGSGLRRMLDWDLELWTEHLRRRDPQLVIIAAGGIESMRRDHEPERWATELDALFERLADALPEAACLFVGPHDRAAKESDGGRRRPATLDEIVATARDRSLAHGCAFWDAGAAMGGPRTMPAWVEAELAMQDHVHFTPRGNALIGRYLVDAIMAAKDPS